MIPIRYAGTISFTLVILFVLVVYAIHAGNYLIFDSYTAIQVNEAIQISGARLDDWRIAALSTDSGPLGRPLSMLSFALDHVVAGELLPVQIKIFNALIHVSLGCVIAFFLYTISRFSPALNWPKERAAAVALLAAAIWLLHPVHVSTVLYAVQRMSQLSALFVMLGLVAFFYRRCQWLDVVPSASEVSRALLLVFLFTLLAAFSKENGLLLPWMVATTELCLFRFMVAGAASAGLRNACLALLLLPLAAVLLRFAWDPSWLDGGYLHREFTLSERLLTQGRVLWQYLGWLVLPDVASMSLYHDDLTLSRNLLTPLTTVFAWAAWLLLAVFAWFWRDRLPLLAFALCWYLMAHSMESSILSLEMVFEHRNYLPYVGPVAFLASLLWTEQAAFKSYRPLVAGVFLLVLSGALFLRSSYWSEEKLLAEHHFRSHPDSLRSHFHLASVYQQQGLAADDPALQQRYYAAARELAQRAFEKSPESIPALVLLAYFDGNSNTPEAAQLWYQALEHAVTRPGLSVSDVKFLEFQNSCVMERTCIAPAAGQLQFLQMIAKLHPAQAILRYQLVRYCLARDKLDCALREAESLLRDHPDFQEALEAVYAVHVLKGDRRKVAATVQRILLLDRRRRLTASLLKSTGSS
jgi:hypothetical protein